MGEDKLLIYEVKKEYIEYLIRVDDTVRKEKDHAGAKTRKYIGVLFTLDSIKYFAPLASPKPKFKNMKNGKDFMKIDSGTYGAINFNNMIPVNDAALVEYDIENESDAKYKDILENQVRFIRKNGSSIQAVATNLYEIMTSGEAKHKKEFDRLKDRCCDFKSLETACLNYTELIV